MCGFQEKPFSESKSSLEIIVIIPPRSESLKEIKKDSGPSTLKKITMKIFSFHEILQYN